MSKQSRQLGLFEPDHQYHQPPKTDNVRAIEDIVPRRKQGENWLAYYKDYFLRRPMGFLIVVGLLLEVQPYEPIQPTYFWANRFVNLKEIELEGVEDEEAHKEGVKAETLAKVEVDKAEKLAQIEEAKECQKQREIAANAANLQCTQSGKAAGYCRHIYEQGKALHCPEMPKL